MMRSSHTKSSASSTLSLPARQTRSQAAANRAIDDNSNHHSVLRLKASPSSLSEKNNVIVSASYDPTSRTGFSKSSNSPLNNGSTMCRRSPRHSIRKEHQIINKSNSKVSSHHKSLGDKSRQQKKSLRKRNIPKKKTTVDKLYSRLILEQKNFMESHKRNQDMQISLLRQLVELQRRSVSIQQEILNTLTGYNRQQQN